LFIKNNSLFLLTGSKTEQGRVEGILSYPFILPISSIIFSGIIKSCLKVGTSNSKFLEIILISNRFKIFVISLKEILIPSIFLTNSNSNFILFGLTFSS